MANTQQQMLLAHICQTIERQARQAQMENAKVMNEIGSSKRTK